MQYQICLANKIVQLYRNNDEATLQLQDLMNSNMPFVSKNKGVV